MYSLKTTTKTTYTYDDNDNVVEEETVQTVEEPSGVKPSPLDGLFQPSYGDELEGVNELTDVAIPLKDVLLGAAGLAGIVALMVRLFKGPNK